MKFNNSVVSLGQEFSMALDRLSRMVFFTYTNCSGEKEGMGSGVENAKERSCSTYPTGACYSFRLLPLLSVELFHNLSLSQLEVVLSYRLSKKFSPVPVVKTVILAAHILSLYYRLHAIEENGWFSQIDHKTHF